MTARTTLHVDNLHCQSCVASVAEAVACVSSAASGDLTKTAPVLSDIDISLENRTLSFTHPEGFYLEEMIKELDTLGFDVSSESNMVAKTLTSRPSPSKWRSLLLSLARRGVGTSQREASHREICRACHSTDGSNSMVSRRPEREMLQDPRSALGGMISSSSASVLSNNFSPTSGVGIHSSQITLRPPSVVIENPVDGNREPIKNVGCGVELGTPKNESSISTIPVDTQATTTYKVILSIVGMTCASCVSSVTQAMESIPGTSSISVDLIGKTGSVVVKHQEDAELVRTEIEDVGFECSVIETLEQRNTENAEKAVSRTVTVRVDGVVGEESVHKVNNTLESLSQDYKLTFAPITLDHPVTTITYTPQPPSFTLRFIREEVASVGFALSVVHVDSVEKRAARARLRDQRFILLRLTITFLFAIPTFVVAVVGMSLLSTSNGFRNYLEMPVWGNATRGTVTLFGLATPVQVWVGWFFYEHAWKSLKGVWRKRRAGADWRKVWFERLFRWGSMDTLVALGTVTSYVASLALMILDIETTPAKGMMGGEMGWFDSSVFLMMFILAGRYLDTITRHHTGDAVSTLSSTKPSTGLLYSPTGSSTTPEQVDFLEVGDVLLVPAGSSPPLDAVLVSTSPSTSFDESSLTGEARPVLKGPGDEVFAGTTNAGPAAAVVAVTSEVGKTMLDGIVGVVRDAMGKKAGIERIADTVTGYFVPFVVGVAALTFGVWCLRGYLGDLPPSWDVNQHRGGWALFAIQFGVAVLVVACPCGIGLAAPTAQMVGVGLAAQHGILSNGGGEAFQTISSLNTVVLDKTGTLTTGTFAVSDHRLLAGSSSRLTIFAILRAAEQASTHPLAVGVREWCHAQLDEKSTTSVELISSEEIPGRGLLAVLVVEDDKIEVAIGNEDLMHTISSRYQSESAEKQSKQDLLAWQMAGKSVILLSARFITQSSAVTSPLPISSEHHTVLSLFGVHDPPRAEASTLIAELRGLHMDVWMISGDNEITAKTVAQSVGIDASHVVAGALPEDKQLWIKRLQNGEKRSEAVRSNKWRETETTRRTIVAFCGDGINDAPAIAQADVGLAMGGGSNVAVSTADFCLLSSNLLSILTVHHIARATRRKIISNFVWACFYNVTLMPLAAGAFFPLGRTTLPPVWGSAAMALSSISVVINSLFLKWLYNPPKAVRKWNNNNQV